MAQKSTHDFMLRLPPSSTTHPETIFIRTKTGESQTKFEGEILHDQCGRV